MSSNIGMPKIINFPFGTNGKLTVLGVPILKHFREVKGLITKLLTQMHISSKSVWHKIYIKIIPSGPGCSKLMTLLVNVSLNFQ